MKIIKFFRLNNIIILLTALIPWLKKQQGWLYPIFLLKVFSYLTSFLIKAQKVGFITMVKYIYYFLSVFNVLLGVLIITNFSDFALNPKILEIMKASLELAIPVMILETINIFIEDLTVFFKNIIKKIIDWVYDKDNIIPDKTPKKSKDGEDILNPFSYSNYSIDDLGYHYPDEYDDIDTKVSWKTVLFFTVLAIGVSYYFVPELYHGIYQGLKDKFFPPSDPKGPSAGGTSIPVSVKGKGVEIINIGTSTGFVEDLSLLQNKVNDIVHSPNLPIEQKMEVLDSFKTSLNLRVSDTSFFKKLDILREGKIYLESQVASTSSLLPLPDSTTSSIPSSLPQPLIASTTTSLPESITPPSPNISTGSVTPKIISPGTTTPAGTLTPKNISSSGFFTPISSPSGSSVALPNISPPELSLTIPSNTPVLSTSTEIVRLGHSPVLEAIPKELEWNPFKGGGKLKGMFTPKISPSDYPRTFNWPEGHISPYDSTTGTPVDGSAPKMIMDKNMDELTTGTPVVSSAHKMIMDKYMDELTTK